MAEPLVWEVVSGSLPGGTGFDREAGCVSGTPAEAGRSPWTGKPKFAHAAEFHTEDERTTLVSSYHPSRQNTQTGRLTREMFLAPFRRAREILDESS